ncbi:MAG: TspO/MBR family protein [Balneolaceae bacterium]
MKNSERFKSILGFIFFISICFLTAWLGAQVSPGMASGDWYATIQKPDWNPPSWVFGPVWSTLYTMMAIAAWIIWKKDGFAGAKMAMVLFFIQLLLNALWSQIFFRFQEIGWAFAEILFLLAAIGYTGFHFYKKDRVAGWLLVPYFGWVFFAAWLNYTIWILN